MQLLTPVCVCPWAPVQRTYKTPKLIATATPSFSFNLICSDQTSFQGRKAKIMSIPAEYPVTALVSVLEGHLLEYAQVLLTCSKHAVSGLNAGGPTHTLLHHIPCFRDRPTFDPLEECVSTQQHIHCGDGKP